MNKENFIKRHSYILTTGAILAAATVLYQNKNISIKDFLSHDKKNIPHEQVQAQEIQKFPKLKLPEEAEKILKKEKKLVCSYYNGLNSYRLYVSDKQQTRQIRETVTNNIAVYHEHLIIKGETAHRWTNRSSQGLNFSITQKLADELFSNLHMVQKPGIYFDCQKWNKINESVFKIPEKINFLIWNSP